MGRQLYPILISTEPPSYTMRYQDTTLSRRTDDGQKTNPLTAKRFARSLAITVLGTLGQRGLTLASWNVKEVHRHAG